MTSHIVVNQNGYVLTGPKKATLINDSSTPLAWQLTDSSGAAVASGVTESVGVDPSLNARTHIIDFTEVTQPGTFTLELTETDTDAVPVTISADPLSDLLTDAVTVFSLQRSGVEIGPDIAGPEYVRRTGHIDVAPNRGDGHVIPLPIGQATTADSVDLYEGWGSGPDGLNYETDATGGWYDAGDAGKYVVNGGISVAGLLAILERAQRGGTSLPQEALDRIASEVTWELDWMKRMVVKPGLPYAGMVHHKVSDEHWTGLPSLPADDPEIRYIHRPSTAATLNLAAVAAQAARVFSGTPFASDMLDLARSTYAAALANPHVLAPDTNLLTNQGSGPYNDVEIDDEFYWAAAELYLTTGEQTFLEDLRANPYHVASFGGTKTPWSEVGFDWRDTAAWVRCQLAVVESDLPERREIQDDLLCQATTLVENQKSFGQLYSPAESHYAWGSNGMMANNGVIVAVAAEVTQTTVLRNAAIESLDYLLGRNGLDISYVTGYGERYVCNQHSRWFAHSLDASLPEPPHGTLSGGPNSDYAGENAAVPADAPAQLCFVDDIGAYQVNEFTINWNAAFALLTAHAIALE